LADEQRADGTPEERSVAELIREVSDETSTLIRQELRLAQLELTQKGKVLGVGLGMFGAGGAVALYGVGALVAAAILALATAVAAWLSALIVAVLLLAAAGLLALRGKREVGQAGVPVPQRAIDSTRQDLQTVKENATR